MHQTWNSQLNIKEILISNNYKDKDLTQQTCFFFLFWFPEILQTRFADLGSKLGSPAAEHKSLGDRKL